MAPRDPNAPPTWSPWSAGIVNHGDYDELVECLESLEAQTQPAQTVRVYDTGVDASALKALVERFPNVTFEGGPNRGYAGGANRLLAALTSDSPAPDYVLLLNADVALDADFCEQLGRAVDRFPEVAIAGGRLVRPGRQRLDSTGVVFPRNRRPRDRGSEEVDRGQYATSETVEGVSGAAMWLRVAALPHLALDGEVFDEDFFAYHEDTDLCWRARVLGWTVWYEASATAVHRRGWRYDARARIPVEVRLHSFKNHYLQLAKNERALDLLRHAPWLVGWEVLRLGFALLRDPSMLKGYAAAARCLPAALRKRRLLREKRLRLGPG